MDKLYHVIAGLGVSFGAGEITDPWTGLMVAAGVGAAKELWDAAGNGTPEFADFAATVLGGALPLLVIQW